MKELKEIKIRELQNKNIKDLRDIGRDVGVKSPTSLSKESLIENIISICFGEELPAASETRGRPAKKKLAEFEENFHYKAFSEVGYNNFDINFGSYAASSQASYGTVRNYKQVYVYRNTSGIFFYDKNFNVAELDDDTAELINNNEYIKSGDFIQIEEYNNKKRVTLINNCVPEKCKNRIDIADLPIDEKLKPMKLEFDNANLKILNGLFPIAYGQRSVFAGSASSGTVESLLEYAISISKDESVTLLPFFSLAMKDRKKDFCEKAKTKAIEYESYPSISAQINAMYLVVHRAKRIAEAGGNAVIIVDDLISIYGAIRAVCTSKFIEEYEQKKILKQLMMLGCKIKNGGSITVICALDVETDIGERLFNIVKNCTTHNICFEKTLSNLGMNPAISPSAGYSMNLDNKEENYFELLNAVNEVFVKNGSTEILQNMYSKIKESKSESEAVEKIKKIKI